MHSCLSELLLTYNSFFHYKLVLHMNIRISERFTSFFAGIESSCYLPQHVTHRNCKIRKALLKCCTLIKEINNSNLIWNDEIVEIEMIMCSYEYNNDKLKLVDRCILSGQFESLIWKKIFLPFLWSQKNVGKFK